MKLINFRPMNGRARTPMPLSVSMRVRVCVVFLLAVRFYRVASIETRSVGFSRSFLSLSLDSSSIYILLAVVSLFISFHLLTVNYRGES